MASWRDGFAAVSCDDAAQCVLEVRDLRAGRVTTVGTGTDLTGYPYASFSPDGRWLAVMNQRDGVLRLVEVQSGAEKRLADTVSNGALPSWSADSRWLAWTSGSNAYVQQADAPAGSEPIRVDLGLRDLNGVLFVP